MASSSDELSQLLRNLASAKSLNTAAPATTQAATFQKAQTSFRDYTVNSIASAPSLDERIREIAAGKPKPASGIGKLLGTAAKPALAALTVWDTPRRAVISGVREVVDILDNDPNTKASVSDWYNQTKDAAYGFGTAFPMEGWGGRFVGFLGDVVFDPMMYASLGTKIARNAVVEGAESLTEAGIKAGTKVASRDLFGKHIVGAEARAKLSEWTLREMRAQNAIKVAAGLAPDYTDDFIQRTASKVASDGKRFVPKEIAERFGLSKPGIYFFGSKVRVPGTGVIADSVTAGLTKMRLGVANSRPGEAILRQITRSGVGGAGRVLSADYVKQARMGLARGNLSGKEVENALRLLTFDEDRRIAATLAQREADNRLRDVVQRIEQSGYRDSLSRLMDNPQADVMNGASAAERQLAAELRPIMDAFWDDVYGAMSEVDPAFQMGKVQKNGYFPWILSDHARKIASSERSVRAEKILQYAKLDVNDMASSFMQRGIHAGMEDFFGVTLTEADLNARRLNEIARKAIGGDLFETDTVKILAYYANNYAEQMGNAAFFNKLKNEPDMMKFIQSSFEMPEEVLASVEEKAVAAAKGVGTKTKELTRTLGSAIDRFESALTVMKSQAERDVKRAAKAVVTDDAVEVARKQVIQSLGELNAAKQALSIARLEMANTIDGKGGIVNELMLSLQKIESEIEQLNREVGLDLAESVVPSSTYVQQITDRAGIKVPQKAADEPLTQAMISQMGGGQFAELSPVEFLSREQVIANVQARMKKIQRDAARWQSTYEMAQLFHNELGSLAGYIDEARLGGLDGNLMDTVFADMGWKYSPEVYGEKKITETTSRGGKLWQNAVTNIFKTENHSDPVIKLVHDAVNPRGVVKQRRLLAMNIDEVRSILVEATTTANNMDDLQHAVAWMMLRELELTPFLKEMVAGIQGPAYSERTREIYGRFLKLQQMTDQIGDLEDARAMINAAVESGDIPLPLDTPSKSGITGRVENYADLKNLHNVKSEIETLKIERDNLRIRQAQSLNDRPLTRIYNAFQELKHEVDGTLPIEDADEIIVRLREAGEVDAAELLDQQLDQDGLTYELVDSVLDFLMKQDTQYDESTIKALSDNFITVDEAGNDITYYDQQIEKLEKKKAEIEKSLPARQKFTDEVSSKAGGYQDFVREYSNLALESFLYSETSLQFRRTAEIMEVHGGVPSYEIFMEIRAHEARKLAEGAQEFGASFAQAQQALETLYEGIRALPPSQQWEALRTNMTTLLASKEGKNVSRFFPEFELVLNRGKLTEFGKQLRADPEYQGLLGQLEDMRIQLLAEKEGGRRTQGVAVVTGPYAPKAVEPGKTDAELMAKNLPAMSRNRANQKGSLEAQAARLRGASTSGKVNNIEQLISQIEDLMDEGVQPLVETLKDLKPAVGWVPAEEFQPKLMALKNQYEAIRTRIKTEQQLARDAAKAAGVKGRKGVTKAIGRTRTIRAANHAYGFGGLFTNATSPSNSASKVREFFGELIGGTHKYVDGKPVAISPLDSYMGRTQKALNIRQSALAGAMETSVQVGPETVTSSVLPGLGKLGSADIVTSARQYANELYDLARTVQARFISDKNTFALWDAAGVDVAKARAGLPFTEQQVDTMLQLINEQPVRMGNNAWRYADANKEVIDSLPEAMRKVVYDIRGLRIKEQRMLISELYPIHESEKTLEDVIGVLSRLEMDKLYDETGAASFDPFSVYGPKIWDEARPGTYDAAGNPIANNADEKAVVAYLSSLPQPRTFHNNIVHAQEVPFNPQSFKTNKTTGRHYTDLFYVDKDGLLIKTNEAGETPFEQARQKYNIGEPFTVLQLKPRRPVEASDLIPIETALFDASRISKGDVYNPAEVWIFQGDEMVQPGTGPMKKVADAAVFRLPYSQPKASNHGFTYKGAPLSFTPQEASALFNPPLVTDDVTVPMLRAQIAELEQKVPTRARTAKEKALKANLKEQIDGLQKKIDDIFNRPMGQKTVAQLQNEIRDFERQIPDARLRVRTAEGRKKLALIDEEIRIRRNQISVIGARYSARQKVQAMIQQAMNNPVLAYNLGAVKKYGDLPNDPIKLFNKIVERMKVGVTPDGVSFEAAADIAKVRKGFVQARYGSSESGKFFKDLADIRNQMKQIRDDGFLTDYKAQLSVLDNAREQAAKIVGEYDPTFSVATALENVDSAIARAKKTGYLVEKDGKTYVKSIDGLKEVKVPRLVPAEGPRASALIAQADTAKSEIKSLTARKRGLQRDVNKLAKEVEAAGADATDAQVARLTQLRTEVVSIDENIAARNLQVEQLQENIRNISSGFSGKTADEIQTIADELYNLKVNQATIIFPGSKVELDAVRQKFGEASKQYQDMEKLLVLLTQDKTNFDALQVAMKQMTDSMTSLGQTITKQEEIRLKSVTALAVAQANFDALTYYRGWADANVIGAKKRLDTLKATIESLQGIKDMPADQLAMKIADFNALYEEAAPLLELMGAGAKRGSKMSNMQKNLKSVMTQYVELQTAYHASIMSMRDAEAMAKVYQGIDNIYKNLPAQGAEVQEWATALAKSENINAVRILEEFDKGWVALGRKFPSMQISPELAEIFQNGHKLADPEIARQFSKFMGAYTRFFKTWATFSPGFHVRNSIANAMALLFGGGNPLYLNEGLQISMKWSKAEAAGMPWTKFLATLTPEQASAAEVARLSTAAAGGGMYSQLEQELKQGGKWVNNRATKASRRYGELADNHARFIFGYDAGRQGMDYRGAAARTKRFFVDYMDMSDLDKTMSTIVPFWMWTSRNLPTQVVNMWLNPKPYLIYNNIRRNFSDDTDSALVPQYLKEMGAWKLPFGDNMFLQLDTGFTQVGPQMEMLKDPQRILSNINPMLRLPIELAGGRQLYSNRPFSEQPVKVEGPMQEVIQPLLQALGYGATNSQGEKFVSDKAYYALRNYLPMLGTFERLNPSIDAYKERGVGNAVAGWLGSPVRQLTPEMQMGALAALKRQIQSEVSRNKALEGTEEQ